MRKRYTLACLAAGLAFALAGNAEAAIILNDTSAYKSTSIKQSSRTITVANIDDGSDSDFVLTGADKLVVALVYEGEGGGRTVTSITYNGAAMTEAIFDLSNGGSGGTNQAVGIFYLDNPSAEGDLVVDFSGNTNGLGVSVWALSNTAAGGPAALSAADGDGQSADITVGAGNTFIVAAHVNNGNGGVAQPPLTMLQNTGVGSAGGGSGHYNYDGPAATIDVDFTGNTQRPVTLSAGFAQVPEPGSLALLGLGGLLIAGRRRR